MDDKSGVATDVSADIARQSVDAKNVQVESNGNEKDLESDPKAAQDSPSPDVVDWDGENDPHYPLNWTNMRKFKNISVICYCTFLT